MLDEAKKCVIRCARCHSIKTKATVKLDTIDEDNIKKSTTFNRKYRERSRNYINNVKTNSNGCVDCGWFDADNLQVLHFDHNDESDKVHDISRLASTGRNIDLIQSEIDKCQILCANCHRKKTLRQFDYPVLQLINNHNDVKV
jgi:cytochrome c553